MSFPKIPGLSGLPLPLLSQDIPELDLGASATDQTRSRSHSLHIQTNPSPSASAPVIAGKRERSPTAVHERALAIFTTTTAGAGDGMSTSDPLLPTGLSSGEKRRRKVRTEIESAEAEKTAATEEGAGSSAVVDLTRLPSRAVPSLPRTASLRHMPPLRSPSTDLKEESGEAGAGSGSFEALARLPSQAAVPSLPRTAFLRPMFPSRTPSVGNGEDETIGSSGIKESTQADALGTSSRLGVVIDFTGRRDIAPAVTTASLLDTLSSARPRVDLEDGTRREVKMSSLAPSRVKYSTPPRLVGSSTRLPPPTPFQINPFRIISSPFVRTAMAILDARRIEKDGKSFVIAPVEGLMGQHAQIYAVIATDPLSEVPNDKMYVKIFHRHVLERSGNTVETCMLSTALAQYDRMKVSGLPIVTIYNRDTAARDGYLAVEKLAPFTLPWEEDTKIADLSAESRLLLDQMKAFFDYGFQDPSSVALDLVSSNFGLKDGKLALLDFMEHDDDIPHGFDCIARKCLTDVSNGNREIYLYLCAGIQKTRPELYARLTSEE
jgi:hypothetical protein